MRTEHRTVYISNDGKKFDTPEAALERDIAYKLEAALSDSSDLFWQDIGPDEVAHWIIENRDYLLATLQELP